MSLLTTFKKIAEACLLVRLVFVLVSAPLIAKIGDAAWLVFGKRPKLDTLADQEFASAVKAAAILRERGQGYCDVTQAFQQMANGLSLAEFRNYVFEHYEGNHG